MRAQGLADLERAVEVNSFFNVFDYIPVLQFLPPVRSGLSAGVRLLHDLSRPTPPRCSASVTQPEICSNAGFAPHNIQGSLTLFGDIYAKAGDLTQAEIWYGLVRCSPTRRAGSFCPPSRSGANTAARVALYADDDPSNDPLVIGAGPEACLNCHNR